jgi:sterol 24-C-methyltransferase
MSAPSHVQAVDAYYEATNDFYRRGWGESFHFAPRFRGETRRESLLRHEYYLAHRLGLAPGMRVLDAGCGVGGPMRNIARFADVMVTGITINAQQVRMADSCNRDAGLSERCSVVRGDFADLPFEDGSFDAAFAIESLCHADDRRAVLAEISRVLRPGGRFAAFEWCLTERYDRHDAEHRRLKRTLEETIALPGLMRCEALDEELAATGFDLLESSDLASTGDPRTPWYRPLTRREGGLQGAAISPLGRMVTHVLSCFLERIGRAPKGTGDVHRMLMRSGDALARSGELGIFTPAYFVLAQKDAAG